MSLKDIFTNGRVYFITFLRLIAVPAVALLLLKVSGLVNRSPDGKKLLLIVFLAVITPLLQQLPRCARYMEMILNMPAQ